MVAALLLACVTSAEQQMQDAAWIVSCFKKTLHASIVAVFACRSQVPSSRARLENICRHMQVVQLLSLLRKPTLCLLGLVSALSLWFWLRHLA